MFGRIGLGAATGLLLASGAAAQWSGPIPAQPNCDGTTLSCAAGQIRALSTITPAVCSVHAVQDGQNYIASGGANTMNTRQSCYAPAASAITDLVVEFPGFYEAVPEANLLIGYAVTASIEYPIGTVTQVTFNGATSQTVTPGKVVYASDPIPVYIPAGAQYFVKAFLSWTNTQNFVFVTGTSIVPGEWMAVGSGLSDHTMDTTVQTSSYTWPTHGFGVNMTVRGRPTTAFPALGFLGDSIANGAYDQPEPVYGRWAYDRGLRGQIPSLNVTRTNETFANYLSAPIGRTNLLRNAVSSLVVQYGENDLNGGASSSTTYANLQATINPYLARGVKVWLGTVTPRRNH